ncbi:putative UDP-glycosyltransferase 85A5-like [Capsicum annuum]|nr:putative UDP-glycosyltransferase 85A5-like [Capsicum annuum]
MGWKGILGFEYGIVQAPLGPDISSPHLVAAVANSGALGFLRVPDWEDPDYVRELIRKTRTLTNKPFGIGVILAFPHKENVKAILDEKVAVLQLYWGECSKELVLEAHKAGVKVVPQIGSYEEAKRAADAGVDAIIVQVDLVRGRDLVVIAAGGIVDERGYVAALALGAQGVSLGTRFLATEESYAHPTYKRKLIEFDQTEYTDIFGRARWPGAPHRVLATPFFMEWKELPNHENESNQPVIGRTIIHGREREVRRFAGTVPNATTTGDIESMAMYAGQSIGLIKEILPAGEVINRIVEGAQRLIDQQFAPAH